MKGLSYLSWSNWMSLRNRKKHIYTFKGGLNFKTIDSYELKTI